jgi:hypothetical protein
MAAPFIEFTIQEQWSVIQFLCTVDMDMGETGWEGVDWKHLAQERDQWRDLVNTVMETVLSVTLSA